MMREESDREEVEEEVEEVEEEVDEFGNRILRIQELRPPENIKSILLKETFSDVAFLVQKKRILAHKSILALQSRCFEKVFLENPNQREFTISKTSPKAFKWFLKYIYAGTNAITLSLETIEFTSQILFLAGRYGFTHLSQEILAKIYGFLRITNVVFFINEASALDVLELQEKCYRFVDRNALEFLRSDWFEKLTQKSLTQLVKSEIFSPPAIEVFKSVVKWSTVNNNNVVLECGRLAFLSVSEIISTVLPTDLVEPEKLLEVIFEIFANGSKQLVRTLDNVATVKNGATVMVVSQETTSNLFDDKTDVSDGIQYSDDEESYIVIRLSKPHVINHIRMKFCNTPYCSYSYCIEASLDQSKWNRIVDYSKYACRSTQNLYFTETVVQYIKIVGRKETIMVSNFKLVFFQTFFKSDIPPTVNGVIRPEGGATSENITITLKEGKLDDKDITVIEVEVSCCRGFTVKLPQPHLLSWMQLVLDNRNNISTYKCFIETSINNKLWESIIDPQGIVCKPSENLHFPERELVSIRISAFISIKNAKLTLLL